MDVVTNDVTFGFTARAGRIYDTDENGEMIDKNSDMILHHIDDTVKIIDELKSKKIPVYAYHNGTPGTQSNKVLGNWVFGIVHNVYTDDEFILVDVAMRGARKVDHDIRRRIIDGTIRHVSWGRDNSMVFYDEDRVSDEYFPGAIMLRTDFDTRELSVVEDPCGERESNKIIKLFNISPKQLQLIDKMYGDSNGPNAGCTNGVVVSAAGCPQVDFGFDMVLVSSVFEFYKRRPQTLIHSISGTSEVTMSDELDKMMQSMTPEDKKRMADIFTKYSADGADTSVSQGQQQAQQQEEQDQGQGQGQGQGQDQQQGQRQAQQQSQQQGKQQEEQQSISIDNMSIEELRALQKDNIDVFDGNGKKVDMGAYIAEKETNQSKAGDEPMQLLRKTMGVLIDKKIHEYEHAGCDTGKLREMKEMNDRVTDIAGFKSVEQILSFMPTMDMQIGKPTKRQASEMNNMQDTQQTRKRYVLNGVKKTPSNAGMYKLSQSPSAHLPSNASELNAMYRQSRRGINQQQPSGHGDVKPLMFFTKAGNDMLSGDQQTFLIPLSKKLPRNTCVIVRE